VEDSRIQSFVEFCLDNFFDIITILIAGYLVIRHQLQPFTAAGISELATWILAVLGLIAVSGLWDRNRRLRRIENLTEENRDLIADRLNKQVKASDFFLAERPLSNDTLKSANAIFLLGYSLSRTIRDYHHLLEQQLAAGAEIRVVVIDPEAETLLQAVALESIASTPETWRRHIEITVTAVRALAQHPHNSGSIKIGYLPYPPSFGMVMIDPNENHGFCYVDIYHHKSTAPNATFKLEAPNDPTWYAFFREQYETLWDSCRVDVLSENAL